MQTLIESSKAPKFALEDRSGVKYGVGITKADFVVLFFYPKDNTPGCTIEAKEFDAALDLFKRSNVALIGISGGDRKSKDKFCLKHELDVPLVSDGDFAVSKAYGVYGDKKFMGRSFQGIHRKTFIIDKNGVIVRVFDNVKPAGHAQQVLDSIAELMER